MDLRERWAHYAGQVGINYSLLPEEVKRQGRRVVFPPDSVLVLRGDFHQYIYFIQSGSVLGQRSNPDGSDYKYFHLDSSNGSVGLLEVFGRKDRYVATIMCVTEVTALVISSAEFYDYVMQDTELLRRCLSQVAGDLYYRSGSDGRYYCMEGINRLRHYLVSYYAAHRRPDTPEVEVLPGYEDIASEIGVSARTVGRGIRRLRENGEIGGGFRRIVISRTFYDALLAHLPR